MASKHEYYELLSRAVAGLDRDAFAARGAVYDREHKALLRRLFSPSSSLTDAEIDEEQWAFRDAIRRIEFGDEPEFGAPTVRRGASQDMFTQVAPPAIPPNASVQDRLEPADPPRRSTRRIDWSRRSVSPDLPASGQSPSLGALSDDA